MKKIMIATGGTGGHIYPAMITAQELKQRGWQVLFVGNLGIAAEKLSGAGFNFIQINVKGFVSKKPLELVSAVICLMSSLGQCLKLVKQFKPDLVLGFGGYSSFPPIMAANVCGVPSMIHEQNAQPGLANKVLAKMAKRVALAFKDAAAFFDRSKIVFTGCPLRVMSQPRDRLKILNEFNFDEKRKTILIFGGSQGSEAINKVCLEVLRSLPKDTLIQIIHSTGKNVEETVQQYKKLFFPSIVKKYIDNMAEAYSVTDLVIARSGAGTVTELGLLGIPAILIPYPYAGNHQIANARVLERLGCAEIIEEKDLKADILRDKIFSALQGCKSREDNQKRLKQEFVADAAVRLVEAVERTAMEKN